jgi:ubiquinone/menaquinone biosynthesis C-methylase UbiE
VTEEIGSAPQYEAFADEFLDHASHGLYNAHYDRPACLDLLGDVAGKRVLDAACGPGLYAEELVRRGASVVGFDISERMVEIARERVPKGEFRVHDLGRPLDWVGDESFDRVLCALAYEYVDDRVGMLRELRRVLEPDGALVMSRMHPTDDWLRHGGNYFETRIVDETWSRGWHVRYWISPLQQTCAEIYEAGFLIERLIEPRPTPEGAHISPDDYDRLQRAPGFLALRLVSARARP